MSFRKVNILLFVFFTSIFCQPLLAQENEKEQPIDEQISLFHQALDKKQFAKAIAYYESAWKLDSTISLPYLVKYLTALASIGEYEKVYICAKVTKRRAQSKGSVTKISNINAST